MSDWRERVARNAQNYQHLRERLSRVTITESSADGLVKVTVSTDGQLTGLTLVEPWKPVPMPAVAEEIMACLRRAQARIHEVVRTTMAETVDVDDPGAAEVLADARRRFPPADTEARPTRRRPPGDEWEERPLLEDV
jgi:DNA-binding protein YbaB